MILQIYFDKQRLCNVYCDVKKFTSLFQVSILKYPCSENLKHTHLPSYKANNLDLLWEFYLWPTYRRNEGRKCFI